MKFGSLKDVTGKFARSSVKWLHARQMGCCSICFATDDRYNYSVCIGWHDGGHGWEVAWKIGRQALNNVMQCDLDVDFDMPGPCNKYGDAYDTLSEVGEFKTMKDWNSLAGEINKAARDAFKRAVEIDEKVMADAK